jgi:hypothetical protein
MSFDGFKSSTVGPEALAARLELEKKNKDLRERDRALRKRDEARRQQKLMLAQEDSKNYDSPEQSEAAAALQIPVLSRGLTSVPTKDQMFKVSTNAGPAKAGNGFKLKRF